MSTGALVKSNSAFSSLTFPNTFHQNGLTPNSDFHLPLPQSLDFPFPYPIRVNRAEELQQ